MDRKTILLRACRDLLQKQNESGYVLNLLEECVTYDGYEVEGSILLEDIIDEIGED